jgi:hypothetical protein
VRQSLLITGAELARDGPYDRTTEQARAFGDLIQFLIGSYLEPRVAVAALSVSPFLVLFAVLFWAFLWASRARSSACPS